MLEDLVEEELNVGLAAGCAVVLLNTGVLLLAGGLVVDLNVGLGVLLHELYLVLSYLL